MLSWNSDDGKKHTTSITGTIRRLKTEGKHTVYQIIDDMLLIAYNNELAATQL